MSTIELQLNPSAPPPAKASLRSLALTLGALSASGPFAIDMYLAAFPRIASDFSTSIARVQYSLSVFLLGLAVGQLLWGTLSDHLGRRLPLLCGCLLYSGGSVISACSGSPTDTKGFQVSKKLEKVGNPSSDTAVLYFDECRVPARYLLGEENAGFGYVMMNFQGERLVAAVQAVAAMQQMVEDAIRYGEERKAFGRPVARFQAWRHKLAEHLTAIEAARWLAYRATDLLQRGEPAVREVSMAKLFACDLAQEVAYDCMQLHGGMGYVLETDIARAWRDVRVMTIAGGTSEIMKELVARSAGL